MTETFLTLTNSGMSHFREFGDRTEVKGFGGEIPKTRQAINPNLGLTPKSYQMVTQRAPRPPRNRQRIAKDFFPLFSRDSCHRPGL